MPRKRSTAPLGSGTRNQISKITNSTTLCPRDTTATFHVPLSAPIQVSPEVFVGPEIGIEIYDFEEVAMPAGVIAGYTLGGGISSIGDLLARLTFADITSGADTIRLDIGAELFFDLL